MIVIKVCVGSSCHLKGAYNVVEELQKQIRIKNLQDKVELKADFCQGNCKEALCVKIGDMVKTKVTPMEIEGLLDKIQ